MFLFRWLKAGFEFVLALIILFEEWGWEPLKKLMACVMSLPILTQISRKIQGLPPYFSLAVLLLPSIFLIPIKLSALLLIHQGYAGIGISVIIAAKLGGTAVVAHIFHLTRPALMRLAWFSRLYTRWADWKEKLLERVRSSWSFRLARLIKRRIHRRINQFKILMADD